MCLPSSLLRYFILTSLVVVQIFICYLFCYLIIVYDLLLLPFYWDASFHFSSGSFIGRAQVPTIKSFILHVKVPTVNSFIGHVKVHVALTVLLDMLRSLWHFLVLFMIYYYCLLLMRLCFTFLQTVLLDMLRSQLIFLLCSSNILNVFNLTIK